MGLLHDIGQLVLDRVSRERYAEAVRSARADRIPLFKAERLRLGTDHAAVGGGLLETWRFPHELVEPIRWHHDPSGCEEAHRPHAFLLQVADWICDSHGVGSSGNDYPVPPSSEQLSALRLTDDSIRALVATVREEPLLSLLLPV